MIDLTLITLYIGSIGFYVYNAKRLDLISKALTVSRERLEDRTRVFNDDVDDLNSEKQALTEIINELGIQKEFNEALMRSRK